MKMRRCAALLFVATLSAYAKDVRIGVLGLFHAKDVDVSAQSGSSLECQPDNQNALSGRHWQVRLARSQAKIITDGRTALASSLTCSDGHGGATEFRLTIPGKISRLYRGKLEIKPVHGEILMIVSMDVETAVASVIAAESPPHAPLEALKAQAVAARSFLMAGGNRHRDFDFCDTTHCQFLRAPPEEKTLAWQAAQVTRGLVLTYRDQTIAAMYSASCGGRTHSLAELGLPEQDYPYFAVVCDYCHRHPEKWVSRISEADAQSLNPTEGSRIKLARSLGWKTIRSNSYSKHHDGGSVLVEGTGAGHGIGLCQRGAAAMAADGSTFVEILKHYYPNTMLRQL